jgi:hypothetical protein
LLTLTLSPDWARKQCPRGAASRGEEQVVANKSELIAKPFRGLGKAIVKLSSKTRFLVAAVAVDSRGSLNVDRARGDRDEDEREEPGAGPDDMPTEREKRDTPIQYGG